MQYDYLIVGGGSAGCVLANRLSANSRNRVCLVEAGPDQRPENMPRSVYQDTFLPDYFQDKRYWTKLTASIDPIGNRSVEEHVAQSVPRRYEQARVVGGGSTVNGQVAIRGIPADYDGWQQRGADGWSFEDVLPYFIRLERDMDFEGPLHGRAGPIPVRRTLPEHWSTFALAARDALAERGIPYHDDMNAEFGDGCFPCPRNNAYDHRVSAAVGYLDEATRQRKNLDIFTDCSVQGLVFDGARPTGVTVRERAGLRTIEGHELIVSCGALHSPGMLMRAGIGPAEHLRDHGIEVRCDRQGVGSNLQDHPLIGIGVHLRPGAHLAGHVRNNFLLQTRFSSGYPDCPAQDMKLSVSARFASSRMGERLGTVQFGPNKAFSKGFVRLRSSNVDDEPLVAFNLLSDARDIGRAKTAVRFAHELLTNAPVKDQIHACWPGIYADSVRNLSARSWWNLIKSDAAAILLDLGGPARDFVMRFAIDPRFSMKDVMADDKTMEAWIREGVLGDWHACGTCRMGAVDDRLAVVDPQGRVIGVPGLRVVDASIMPDVPCGNTNFPTMMLAEKMSDHILADTASS